MLKRSILCGGRKRLKILEEFVMIFIIRFDTKELMEEQKNETL